MNLPQFGFLRLVDIIGDPKANPPILGCYPVSKTTWYDGIKKGKYPAPVKLSERSSGWAVEDILSLIESTKNRRAGLHATQWYGQ